MAYQVGSSCYPSAVAAASAVASAMGGSIVQHGSAAYVIEVGPVGSTSITYVLNPVDGGAALTLAAPYSAIECQLLDWPDALQLGWMVAAAWIGTVAVLFLARAIKGGDDGRDS